MEKEVKIEMRKGIIVIGMISSGKSTFLNSLLGITYLEAKDDITTKFVCVIRYNPNLKEPIFYHLKIIREEEEYTFIKEGKEFIGVEEIVSKISQINCDEASKEPKYDNLFYMLETNISNIENKDFLQTHDFYDIPGLNEYIGKETKNQEEEKNEEIKKEEETKEEETKEEEIKKEEETKEEETKEEETKEEETKEEETKKGEEEIQKEEIKEEENKEEETKKDKIDDRDKHVEKSNEDMRYIKGLFKYIKSNIEREIIILNSETYYKPQNIQIIEEVKKQFNVPLEQNLIILNKIDMSPNPNETLKKCVAFFDNEIDDKIFNISFNTIIPLDSRQFKNEMLMKSNFEEYLMYYFNKYYERFVITKQFAAPPVLNENHETETPMSFVNFLALKIAEGKEDVNLEQYIENLASDVDDEKVENVKKLFEKIKYDNNKIIDFGINFDKKINDENKNEEEEEKEEEEEGEDDEKIINILKAFIKNFEDKINIPTYSENVQSILNYFNDFEDIIINETPQPIYSQEIEENDNEKAIKDLMDIFSKLDKYIDKTDKNHIINILGNDLRILQKFIKNGKKIYIPFLGVSNAGKSTILNCIIGYPLFPEALEECTTRGIIVQYSDKVELYRTQVDSQNNYYIFYEYGKPIATGKDKVISKLISFNEKFGKDESQYFYIIKTPIKFFDDFNFDDELKQNISLIDLPGSDTQAENKFNIKYNNERNVYEKLLSISSSFIFINKGRDFKNTQNQQLLRNLYSNIEDCSKIHGMDYLQSCLFVINMFQKLEEQSRDLKKINDDISFILTDSDSYSNYISSTIFDAKSYSEYLSELNSLSNYEKLFMNFQNEFLIQFKGLNFFNFLNEKNFVKFCLTKIKNKISSLSIEIDKSKKPNEDFSAIINLCISTCMDNMKRRIQKSDKKTIKEITNLLYQIKDSFKTMKFYQDSYCEQFFKSLYGKIKQSQEYKKIDFDKRIRNSINYFDQFFGKDIQKKSENAENLIKEKNEKVELLKEIFDGFNFERPFTDLKKVLTIYFQEQKENTDQLLKENENDIKKVEEVFTKNIEEKFDTFKNDFDERYKKFQNKLSNIFDDVRTLVKNSIKLDKDLQIDLDKLEITEFNKHFYYKLGYENVSTIATSITAAIYGFLLFGFAGILKGGIPLLIRFFKNLFTSKNAKIKEKIDELSKLVLERIESKERHFSLRFEEQKNQTIEEVSKFLALALDSLENIEKNEWNECKNKFYQARSLLFPNETNINNNERQEQNFEEQID